MKRALSPSCDEDSKNDAEVTANQSSVSETSSDTRERIETAHSTVVDDENEGDEPDKFVIEQLKNRRELEPELPDAGIDSSSAVDVQFSPTSNNMCVCFAKKLVFYALQDGKFEKTSEVKIKKCKSLEAVRYDSSGTYIYSISENCLLSLQPGDDSPPDSSEPLEDKAVVVAVGESNVVVGTENGKIHVFDVQNLNLVFSMIMGHSQIDALVIRDDNVYTISENQVCSVNMSTRLLENEVDHTTDLLCGTEHNDSLVCGSSAGEIVLYKLSNLTPQGTFSVCRRNSVLDIVSINGSYVAVSLDTGHIKLYSLFPHAEVGIIGSVDTVSTKLDVSFDGEWLVAKDNMSGIKLFKISFVKQKASSRPKKRKKGRSSRHLPTSSFEDSNAFFTFLDSKF